MKGVGRVVFLLSPNVESFLWSPEDNLETASSLRELEEIGT